MLRENRGDDRLTDSTTPCLRSLIWAAGRLGGAPDVLLTLATTRSDDSLFRPLRREALAALTAGAPSDAVVVALEAAIDDTDPDIRAMAAEALGRYDPRRAERLAERLMDDRISFDRLAAGPGVQVTEAARKAAARVDYQGVALPYLIARGDLDSLAALAADRKLPEAVRLGAIEGLAKMANEQAEAKLVALGTATDEDEDLRKAAWRGRRRSIRARQPRPPRSPVSRTKAGKS
jgi:ParB family chromosome partitioning protein